MKFSTREDIEAPIAFVFAQLSDFEALERAAMRRGAEVIRLDRRPEPGPGMAWSIDFRWRGRDRKLLVDLRRYEPDIALQSAAESTGYNAVLDLSFAAMSRQRTRIGVEIDLRPRNLSSRLILQSMKLGKATLDRKLKNRVRHLAEDLAISWREKTG